MAEKFEVALNFRLWFSENRQPAVLFLFLILNYCTPFVYPGNAEFIEKEHNAVNSILDECIEPQPTACNKETGGKQRLQKWSRGHLFIVRGGGTIDKWSPLFKWVKYIF